MIIFPTDNIHTIRIKATVMKSIAVALVVFAIVTLIVLPTIVTFVYSLDDAVGVFLVFFALNAVVGIFGGIFISDLPTALGKIREHDEVFDEYVQLKVEEVLSNCDCRRNNH